MATARNVFRETRLFTRVLQIVVDRYSGPRMRCLMYRSIVCSRLIWKRHLHDMKSALRSRHVSAVLVGGSPTEGVQCPVSHGIRLSATADTRAASALACDGSSPKAIRGSITLPIRTSSTSWMARDSGL